MPAADIGNGDVLAILFWVLFLGFWVFLAYVAFRDIVRNDELSGVKKALWTLSLVVLPYLGALAYLGIYGSGMATRERRAQEKKRPKPTPRRAAPPPTSSELANLSELHAAGALDDDEFERAKASLLDD